MKGAARNNIPGTTTGGGSHLVAQAEQYAQQRGVRRIYLLTASAADFFARLGYKRIGRDGAPGAIRMTSEFAALCPVSSVLMTKEVSMATAKQDASDLYEVEHRATHAARPGFRINELTISPTQKVPWHYHNNVSDTFYVVEGAIRIFMQQPKEAVRLAVGQTYTVPARRPHLVTNGGQGSATFLVLQGMGEYDFVPLLAERTKAAQD